MQTASEHPSDATGSNKPEGLSPAPPVEEGTPEIQLTPKAVEMAKKALVRRGTPEAYLRLGVRGGGCSGLAYAIEFSDKLRTRDLVFEFGDLRVLVDPKSLVFLRGSTLDYEVKLMGHGFKFVNPNEKGGCGCGESFIV